MELDIHTYYVAFRAGDKVGGLQLQLSECVGSPEGFNKLIQLTKDALDEAGLNTSDWHISGINLLCTGHDHRHPEGLKRVDI